jgi:hypothetical protein
VVKNLESLISNCRKRLQEINEIKAMAENGQEMSAEDEEKVSKHAQVYTELQSLEQRFRQHKGHRRENAQEKEARAKEEAEATTLVTKKDRAVTPPWERGRKGLESVGDHMKQTEKEKSEWAAIGKRRENATPMDRPTPKAADTRVSEDPWEKMGRARQDAPTPMATPSHRGRKEDEVDDFRFGASSSMSGKDRGGKDRGKGGRGDEDEAMSWRRSEEPKGKGAEKTPAAKDEDGGRPRFFNSKKASDAKPSWRDRMANPDAGRKDDPPPPPPPEEPSWRDQESDGPSWRDRAPAPLSEEPIASRGSWRDRMSAMAEPPAPPPPETAPGVTPAPAHAPTLRTPTGGTLQSTTPASPLQSSLPAALQGSPEFGGGAMYNQQGQYAQSPTGAGMYNQQAGQFVQTPSGGQQGFVPQSQQGYTQPQGYSQSQGYQQQQMQQMYGYAANGQMYYMQPGQQTPSGGQQMGGQQMGGQQMGGQQMYGAYNPTGNGSQQWMGQMQQQQQPVQQQQQQYMSYGQQGMQQGGYGAYQDSGYQASGDVSSYNPNYYDDGMGDDYGHEGGYDDMDDGYDMRATPSGRGRGRGKGGGKNVQYEPNRRQGDYSDYGKGGGKDKGGGKKDKGGGKGSKDKGGGRGQDRGSGDDDWAALGRLRSSA